MGKLRYAFLQGPVLSYKEPKRLASTAPDTGLYVDAFGVDGQQSRNWPKSTLDEAMFAYALDTVIVERAEEYKKRGHQYGRWLKRMSRYVVGLVGQVSNQAPELKVDPKIFLTLSREEFVSRLDPLIKAAMSKINERYEVLKEHRVQPEYDIARDQSFFDTLVRVLVADLTA